MQFGIGAGAGATPGLIAPAGPQYQISRAAPFAQRPSSLLIRSDDSITPVSAGDINAASFNVPLLEPVKDAQAVVLKTFNMRNLVAPIPLYQGWFLYGVEAPGILAQPIIKVFKWGASYGCPVDQHSMPPVTTTADFCARLTADAEYAIPLPATAFWTPVGGQLTFSAYKAWLDAQLANPLYVPSFNLAFGANVDGTITLQGPAQGGNAKYLLFGTQAATAIMGARLLRPDLTLNSLVGQETILGNSAYFSEPQGGNPAPPPGSIGYLGVLELTEPPKFDGTQSVYVACNITSSGVYLARDRSRAVIAVVPLSSVPYGKYVTYLAQSTTSWITQVSQYISDVRIELLDENLQPLDLPFNTLVELELAFLYKDSYL